jgi:hypothetical protein
MPPSKRNLIQGNGKAQEVKSAGISSVFAATVFRPKATRAPQPDDVRHAQGGYAKAQKVAGLKPGEGATGSAAPRDTARPGGALNVKA